jgi:hypothetical protein
MKMLKNLFASLLFAVLTFTASAQVTHNITVGSGTVNVTAAVGDILHFTPGAGVINMLVVWTPTMTSISVYDYSVTITDTAYYATNSVGGTTYGKITIPNITSVKELNDTVTIKLFPNPATNVVQVTTIDKANLIVFTTTGQAVITTTLNAGATDIDVSKLTSGLYYVKIGDAVSKLIKE